MKDIKSVWGFISNHIHLAIVVALLGTIILKPAELRSAYQEILLLVAKGNK